ncbi:unnamed protein product [Brugia pahangi]|uniref:Peptidase A1 domain-containing protein n=1 Tax=Brugia pahangi TaxID=6280 RepID=A0A0N4TXX1_BRUPA|nr:unnamed protein product [Brugia pahangi]
MLTYQSTGPNEFSQTLEHRPKARSPTTAFTRLVAAGTVFGKIIFAKKQHLESIAKNHELYHYSDCASWTYMLSTLLLHTADATAGTDVFNGTDWVYAEFVITTCDPCFAGRKCSCNYTQPCQSMLNFDSCLDCNVPLRFMTG